MEILLLPLSAMGVVFITAPFAAFLLAAVFAGLYYARRSKIVLLTALLWFSYAIYEYGMKMRWLCTGECNIRIDLMLIYPLLVGISLLALIMFLKTRKNA